MNNNSKKYVAYLFVLIIAPTIASKFYWWDDNMETYDVSGWTWLEDETSVTWNKRDKVRLEMLTPRREPITHLERYVWTLPEPKTGDSFQGQSFPLIAATQASCGTAVTIEIKNYLNESLYGEVVLEAGELLRTAPDEIRAKYKEVLVIRDDSNSPKAEVVYTVGNTTVGFLASFRMIGKTVEIILTKKTPVGFGGYISMVAGPLGPNFTRTPERFHLPIYRRHYTKVANMKLGEVAVLLTSRLTLPGRFAVTIQVFPSDLTEYYNKLEILEKWQNNKDLLGLSFFKFNPQNM